MTTPADPTEPQIPTLQLLAAAAKAINAGRSFQDTQDRMAEILATGPDDVETLRQKAQAMTSPACTNPQPIPVSHASQQHQVFCGTCRFRGPIVGDAKTARQHFQSVHGTPILDAVFPPAECDYDPDQQPTMARRGGNCVPDDEWTPVSSDSPFGAQR